MSKSHLVIPDCQIRPDSNMKFLKWIGRMIVDRKPDVIINIGDFADMESLCSYDRGKKCFEGRRYQADVRSARAGMSCLLAPVEEYNRGRRRDKKRVYRPDMHLTLGNHEDRITRAVEQQPELEGVVSISDLGYSEFGWQVHPYLQPIVVDGVAYAHYFYNKLSGRPHPNSRLMLQREHMSCTQGHVQVLDYEIQYTGSGRPIIGIRAGSCYLDDEEYKGPQGNHHWRGVIWKERVKDGAYDPSFLSLDWLKENYG